MEKKIWTAPRAIVEQFEMTQYIAACGDSGITYKFKCTAGGGASGQVYVETNGVSGLQTESKGHWEGWNYVWDYYADESLGGYHACDVEHTAESTDDFLNGYYVPYGGSATSVVIWKGANSDNVHCTTELDQSKWETAKS